MYYSMAVSVGICNSFETQSYPDKMLRVISKSLRDIKSIFFVLKVGSLLRPWSVSGDPPFERIP